MIDMINPGLDTARTSMAGQNQRAAASHQEKKVREACQGFETMFLQMMYRQMRKTVPENTLFGKSNAEQLWQSMLDDAMMENISKGGGIGLADMIYEQLAMRKQI